MPITLTVNSSVRKPYDLQTVTFQDFKELYDTVRASASEGAKDDSDLIVPVAEWSELYRVDENVVRMARVFMADLDAKTEDEIDHVLTNLEAQGVSFFAYTTHSHLQPVKKCLCCYRLCIELDAEYPPHHHKALWDRIQTTLLLGHNDEGTRKVSLGHYLPQYPPEGAHSYDCAFFEGHPLVTGLAPGSVRETAPQTVEAPPPPPVVPPVPAEPPPSIHVLENLLSGWVRQTRDAERKATAKAARALLQGRNEIPVHAGRRNNFLASLAGYLAAQFPYAVGVASCFEGVGWDLFNPDGKYPLEHFDSMIERFQSAEQEQRAAAKAEAAAEQAKRIATATGGERDWTVTDEEVAHLREVFGEDWQGHVLALYKRDIYFLRPDGTYDPAPVMREILYAAAKTRLAIFGDRVEYTYTNQKGDTVQKSPANFVTEYGHAVRRVVYDMGRPDGGYDAELDWIYLETAKPKHEAKEHPQIHKWLEHMDTHLVDMLATMPHLTTMAPALVLTGKASAGKTLLALGVGQIYGSDPLDGEDAFGKYTADLLTRQPIIFMDEKASSQYEKEGTTLIRKFVTQGTRRMEEKYQAKVDLFGYPRLIIAANNADVLTTKQDMSDEDHAAFAERLVHVDMAPGAKYLSRYDRPYIQANWLDGGMLPQHIMWLAENWEIRNPGARFAVASNNTEMHHGLVSRSGTAGDVAFWLLMFLDSPEKAKHLPVKYDPDKRWLRCSSQAIVSGWNIYLDGHKKPAPNLAGRSLKGLSSGGRQKITCVVNGTERTYNAWQIDPRKLRGVNDTHGVLEDFDSVLA